MACTKCRNRVLLRILVFIYILLNINLGVYCKELQEGKDTTSAKSDDFSEFDQEFDSDGSEDDSEFGYVSTSDQEADSNQQGDFKLKK